MEITPAENRSSFSRQCLVNVSLMDVDLWKQKPKLVFIKFLMEILQEKSCVVNCGLKQSNLEKLTTMTMSVAATLCQVRNRFIFFEF